MCNEPLAIHRSVQHFHRHPCDTSATRFLPLQIRGESSYLRPRTIVILPGSRGSPHKTWTSGPWERETLRDILCDRGSPCHKRKSVLPKKNPNLRSWKMQIYPHANHPFRLFFRFIRNCFVADNHKLLFVWLWSPPTPGLVSITLL